MIRRCSSHVCIGIALSLGLFFVLSPAAASAVDLGTSQSFRVDNSFDASGRANISATLRAVGTSAYFWVDDQYWSNLTDNERQSFQSALNVLAQEFDNVIAPRERAFFGADPNPGVDGDPRVYILLEDLQTSAGGYFDPDNVFPRLRNPDSNEHEMIALNVKHLLTSRAKGFLAHEFQHLITANQKDLRLSRTDEVWLNELRSEYAPTLVGYNAPFEGSNLQSRVNAFLRKPHDSLTEWTNQSEDYGVVSMFGHYLADQYGEAVIRFSLTSSKAGIPSLEEALAQLGSSEKFGDVFQNWAVANIINTVSVGQGRYGYKTPILQSLRASPNATYTLGPGQVVNVFQSTASWAAWTYRFVGSGGVLQLSFQGSPTGGSLFRVAAIVELNDGTWQVKPVRMKNETGALMVPELGAQVRSVTLIAFDTYKTVGFSEREPQTAFSLSARVGTAVLPTIASVSPAQTSTAGGTIVIVEGANFAAGARVFFGSAESPQVSFISSQQLQVTTPAGISGSVPVEVLNPDGASVARDGLLTFVVGQNTPPAVPTPTAPPPSASSSIVQPPAPVIPEGALIRARGDFKVWVVHGSFRRHIISATIFSFYRHFGFEGVIEVEPAVLNRYTESRLIRAVGDSRVYEIDTAGRKRWLRMSAEQFFASGRLAQAIYDINTRERDFYRTGTSVTR
ncbi:IPT/TIG domain-containing protein [Candidatus Parcubacteria bacterium]|nr:IPT/TIG domain-containing protein [Candidatus Parcubacteria bacterium]